MELAVVGGEPELTFGECSCGASPVASKGSGGALRRYRVRVTLGAVVTPGAARAGARRGPAGRGASSRLHSGKDHSQAGVVTPH